MTWRHMHFNAVPDGIEFEYRPPDGIGAWRYTRTFAEMAASARAAKPVGHVNEAATHMWVERIRRELAGKLWFAKLADVGQNSSD